jgi:leucyl aminopeptidase
MSVGCVCQPVFGPGKTPEPNALWAASGFDGGLGQTLLIPGDDSPLLLVGFGPAEAVSDEALRESAALAAQVLSRADSAVWDFDLLAQLALPARRIAQTLAEGVTLGSYQPGGSARTRWLVPADHREGWAAGVSIGQATVRARDLVNSPPNILTTRAFAGHCERIGAEHGLTVRIRGQDDLISLGFGGIVAIGRGSMEPSLLVEVTHPGVGAKPDLSLVGKGVIFDSGGLSLKGAEDMIGMKQDMAGAAAVFEAMTLLPLLAPHLHVTAYLPIVENLPGQGAARPGDVVTMRSGSTVEILNTDFEGRVILADALAYAAEHSPAAIIDLATLTNAAVRALGERTAALMSNDRQLSDLVCAAAESSNEPVWELPMPKYLEQQLKSDVADYKNFPGTANARALTAAMFLRKFVPDDIPWAHLDIAGPAWAPKAYGLTSQGGTGFGVRLLADLFQNWTESHSVTTRTTERAE